MNTTVHVHVPVGVERLFIPTNTRYYRGLAGEAETFNTHGESMQHGMPGEPIAFIFCNRKRDHDEQRGAGVVQFPPNIVVVEKWIWGA